MRKPASKPAGGLLCFTANVQAKDLQGTKVYTVGIWTLPRTPGSGLVPESKLSDTAAFEAALTDFFLSTDEGCSGGNKPDCAVPAQRPRGSSPDSGGLADRMHRRCSSRVGVRASDLIDEGPNQLLL
jgi:hypothetical protein